MSAPRRLSHYIAAAPRHTADGETVTNPSTGEAALILPVVTPDLVEEAIEAADKAFRRWREVMPQERGRVLNAAASRLRERSEDIARAVAVETGKPIAEARSEVGSAANYLDWFAGEAVRIEGMMLSGPSADAMTTVEYEPVGVVAAYTAWNFPVSLVCRKLGPALAAGCTVILRPAAEGGTAGRIVAECFEQAGAPPGVVNVVYGDPRIINGAVNGDPRVRKISFTGSVPVGRELMRGAADTLKRLSLELGGHAPVIVFDDQDGRAIGREAAKRKFANAGQICVSPSRFLVERRVYGAFVDGFCDTAKSLRIGDALDRETQMGPIVNARRHDALTVLIGQARSTSREVIGGGRPDGLNRGYFLRPAVALEPDLDGPLMTQEIFGPIAPILPFDDEDEALAIANRLELGLAGYVFTHDLNRARRFGRRLEVGMVGINTLRFGMPNMPFGGVKQSGFGREGSRLGVQDYLQTRSMVYAI